MERYPTTIWTKSHEVPGVEPTDGPDDLLRDLDAEILEWQRAACGGEPPPPSPDNPLHYPGKPLYPTFPSNWMQRLDTEENSKSASDA